MGGEYVGIGVFSVDYLVPLTVSDGASHATTTWELAAPCPLITAVLAQSHPGPVHDIGTVDGHLALIAKAVSPATRVTAWASTNDIARIRANADVNDLDIVVADVSVLPPTNKPDVADPGGVVIVRTAQQMARALRWGRPGAILIAGTSEIDIRGITPVAGYSPLLLDAQGCPVQADQEGLALVAILAPDDEVSATLRALDAARQALARRSPQDPVTADWANRSTKAALRLADLERRRSSDRERLMQREVDRALDQMSAAHSECLAMRNSRSWRMTRFMRRLKQP